MYFFKITEDQPLEHAMVSRALEQSQVKVEGFNFDSRKHLVEYDDVINRQREILYSMRRRVLMAESDKDELENLVKTMYEEELRELLNMYLYIENQSPDYEKIVDEFHLLIPSDKKTLLDKLPNLDKDKAEDYLIAKIDKFYKKKELEFGGELWVRVIQAIYLSTIDKYWTEHLTAIDDLREGINLRGYAQLDPLTEYKNEAFSMFEKLLSDIDFETARRLFHVVRQEEEAPQLREAPKRTMQFKSASAINPYATPEENTPQTTVTQSPTVKGKKIGRNDPCHCGSGKKYKRCHYPN